MNLNGKVDHNDLLALYANLNKPNATWLNGDVDQNGTVDLSDLAIVQSHLTAPSLSVLKILKSPAKSPQKHPSPRPKRFQNTKSSKNIDKPFRILAGQRSYVLIRVFI